MTPDMPPGSASRPRGCGGREGGFHVVKVNLEGLRGQDSGMEIREQAWRLLCRLGVYLLLAGP